MFIEINLNTIGGGSCKALVNIQHIVAMGTCDELTEIMISSGETINSNTSLEEIKEKISFHTSLEKKWDCSAHHKMNKDKDELCRICGKPLNPDF